jgi:hypothetical protein
MISRCKQLSNGSFKVNHVGKYDLMIWNAKTWLANKRMYIVTPLDASVQCI